MSRKSDVSFPGFMDPSEIEDVMVWYTLSIIRCALYGNKANNLLSSQKSKSSKESKSLAKVRHNHGSLAMS